MPEAETNGPTSEKWLGEPEALGDPDEVVARRAQMPPGHPRLAAIVVALLVILALTSIVSVILIKCSASTNDNSAFFGGAVLFTVSVSATFILGFFYPIWFVEPRAIGAIRALIPDARVWPGHRTPGLSALAIVETPTSLKRRIYFAITEHALTIWNREGEEMVVVLAIPRVRIDAIEREIVSAGFAIGDGVLVTFASSDGLAVLPLLPRVIRESSDYEASALAGALSPQAFPPE